MYGKRKSYNTKGGSVRVCFEGGEGVISVITDEIINVFSQVSNLGHRSKANEG